jgi:hypothetical protein
MSTGDRCKMLVASPRSWKHPKYGVQGLGTEHPSKCARNSVVAELAVLGQFQRISRQGQLLSIEPSFDSLSFDDSARGPASPNTKR